MKRKWIITGVCVSLIAAIIFTCFYPYFERNAKLNVNNPLESVENMDFIYRNSYLLYRDLYNKQNGTSESFLDLYLKPAEGCEVSQNEYFLETIEKLHDYGYFYGVEGRENAVAELIGNDYYNQILNSVTDVGMQEIMEVSGYLKEYFQQTNSYFGEMNATYDYIIEDTNTGEYITNMPSKDFDLNKQFFCVRFQFDENGNVSVDSNVRGSDEVKIRKNANEVIRTCNLENIVASRNHYTEYQKYLRLEMPRNCIVTFCISNTEWQEIYEGEYSDNTYIITDHGYYSIVFDEYDAYRNGGCSETYLFLLLVVALAAFIVPERMVGKPWEEYKVCRPAIEILATLGFFVTALWSVIINLIMWVQNGTGADKLDFLMPHAIAVILVYLVNLLCLTVIFFVAYYIGVCVREIRECGLKTYIKKRWFFYQLFPYCKRKFQEVYDMVSHYDVTQDAKKTILKVVLINAVIVFIISSLWIGGFMIAIVYSVVLYIILKKYISDLQKNYGVLLGAINKIAEGELNVAITEDLGVFEPFKPQVIRIQSGFKKAVDEEVKSQRMKTELITNVSHDLKTPLTAIITYVNLLKDEKVTEEQRKEYLDTLERKSLRLKVLIEDLFEVSKANSRNVTLNYVDVDIINLIKQISFEMADKMEASRLDVRMNLPEQKILVSLDSQKTYRIYENLFGNIAKYALNGTRVYVDAIIHEECIEITLKNITADEIFVNAEELTERFVRGDASRNTEGSGLGLAIAKSFTELQGGSLDIQVDGDLFKVTTTWKLNKK